MLTFAIVFFVFYIYGCCTTATNFTKAKLSKRLAVVRTSVGKDTHAIDLDDKVVADPTTLVRGRELDHALMTGHVHFQADDLALLGNALAGNVLDEEWLLLFLTGVGRRVVAGGLDAGLGVDPRPLLADVAKGLVGDGGLFCRHKQLIRGAMETRHTEKWAAGVDGVNGDDGHTWRRGQGGKTALRTTRRQA